MTMYSKILPILFLASFLQLLSASSIDLIQDEDYIPFQAMLTQDIDAEQGPLRQGERIVVIRPISKNTVHVEVPRKGFHTLHVDVTNLVEEIKARKNSKDPNFRLDPRMSFFLANRVVTGESAWQHVLRTDLIFTAERWILLYGDAQKESAKQAVVAASDYYSKLDPELREKTIFVYMDVPGNKAAIQELANTTQPTIQCMPGYLSRGYSRSFDHLGQDTQLPLLVELASSGRVLHQVESLEQVVAWLENSR
jgi:hypothetical protein